MSTDKEPIPVEKPAHPVYKGWGSLKLIGRVRERFKELIHKGWDWRSYYNGWLEGRAGMLQEMQKEWDAPSPGLRWVKAKERLPSDNRSYPVRWVSLNGQKDNLLLTTCGRIEELLRHELDLEVEWLEEAPGATDSNPTCSYPNCYPEGGGDGKESLAESIGFTNTDDLKFSFSGYTLREGYFGGKYHGYPECCILWYLTELENKEKDHLPGADLLQNGFLPCPHHQQMIREGKIKIEDLISNRLSPEPFSTPEAQPIAGEQGINYFVTHGNCQLHGPYVGQCLICNTGAVTTTDANVQPIADDKEVPEEITQWIEHQLDEQGILAGSYIFKQGAVVMYHKMEREEEEFAQMCRNDFNSYKAIEDEKLRAARNEISTQGKQIAKLLAELKEADERALEIASERDAAQNDLTALIDEALQKSKRLDEVGKALIELMADVRNKPNDTRYATHMKRAQAVLDKYPSPAPTNKDK